MAALNWPSLSLVEITSIIIYTTLKLCFWVPNDMIHVTKGYLSSEFQSEFVLKKAFFPYIFSKNDISYKNIN